MYLLEHKKTIILLGAVLLGLAVFWNFFRPSSEPAWLYNQNISPTPTATSVSMDQLLNDLDAIEYEFLDQEFDSLETELDQLQQEF